MSNDVAKLYLKNKLDEQVRFLEEYNQRDDPEYPGWTFLLSPVVKEYGICPYLDVKEDNGQSLKSMRMGWLANQKDGGALYKDCVGIFLDQQQMIDLENDIESTRNHMREYVLQVILDLNSESKAEDDVAMEVNHDQLIDNIKLRKDAKSQNKKVKECWNQTLRCLDYLYLNKGVDFSKYVQAFYGWTVKYKPPVGGEIDPKFESLHEHFVNSTSKLNNLKLRLEHQREDAEQHLAALIKQNFLSAQQGSYFKKWSSLTQEKKEDRIQSYCEWFARKSNKGMRFAESMKKFVLEKLSSKEMRIMDVKWDSSSGIISDINIKVNDDDTFEVGKRAPRILKSSRKISKKKRDELFQSDNEKVILQRINRLLLFELLKGQTLNKDVIVKTVVKNLHLRTMPELHVSDYIAAKYEEVLEVIKSNPIE